MNKYQKELSKYINTRRDKTVLSYYKLRKAVRIVDKLIYAEQQENIINEHIPEKIS